MFDLVFFVSIVIGGLLGLNWYLKTSNNPPASISVLSINSRILRIAKNNTQSYFYIILKNRISEMETYDYEGRESHRRHYINAVLSRIETYILEYDIDVANLSFDEVHDIIDWRY